MNHCDSRQVLNKYISTKCGIAEHNMNSIKQKNKLKYPMLENSDIVISYTGNDFIVYEGLLSDLFKKERSKQVMHFQLSTYSDHKRHP